MKLNKAGLYNLIKEELGQLYEADVAEVVEKLNNAITNIDEVINSLVDDMYQEVKETLETTKTTIKSVGDKISPLGQQQGMTMGGPEALEEAIPVPIAKTDDKKKDSEKGFDVGPTGKKKKKLIQGEELHFEDLTEEELQEMILDELESLYE